MDPSKSSLPVGETIYLLGYVTSLTLKAHKWPDNDQSTILASPEAKLISHTEVQRDPVFTSRVSVYTVYYLAVHWRPAPVKIGTTLCYIILRPSAGLAGLADASLKTLRSDFLTCNLSEYPDKYTMHPTGEGDKYGVAVELPPCLQSLFTMSGKVRKAPPSAEGHWPHQDDVVIFIQKIEIEPDYAGKSLLAPIVRNLQSLICCHPDIPSSLHITGNICWVLEPGLIQNEKSEQIWAHILEGKSEQEGGQAVVDALFSRYTHIGFSKAAQKEHLTRDGDGPSYQQLHQYMIQRTRATSHRDEPIDVLGADPIVPAEVPNAKPARPRKAPVEDEDEDEYMDDEESEFEPDEDEYSDHEEEDEPVPSDGEHRIPRSPSRPAKQKCVMPPTSANDSSLAPILDEIVYTPPRSNFTPASQSSTSASRPRKRNRDHDDEDDEDDEDSKPHQHRKSRRTIGSSSSTSSTSKAELPVRVVKPPRIPAPKTNRRTRSQGNAHVETWPEEG